MYSFFLGSLIFLGFAARLKQNNSSSSGLLSGCCIISSSFSSTVSFFGPSHILFPSVGLLTGVEGSGMVSRDEVPADDWLSSVSPPMSMSGVPVSCSWEASTSSSSLPSSPPASATLDAVLQQRIDTKIYLQFFTIFYKLLHYRNNMHECM